MTEAELLRAVLDYAEWMWRPIGAEEKIEVMALLRSRLLDAVRAFAFDDFVRRERESLHMEYWLGGKEVPTGPLRDAMTALASAISALRELESKP